MSTRTPIACFRDVLVYCEFTESKNQEIPYVDYLATTAPVKVMTDFVEFGLKHCGITSKNFLGDPEGIRQLFVEIMCGGEKMPPAGWLEKLKIKHFGRYWRLLGKEIELIDTTPFLPVCELPRVLNINEVNLELDRINQTALMAGYKRNRALYGEHFAGIIACAFISMHLYVRRCDVSTMRRVLENKLNGG